MKRLIVVLAGLLLLSSCSKDKYMANPDGSRPDLFPVATVRTWQVVDGAYQAPSGKVRIYLQDSTRFGDDVQLGNGVRIGSRSYVDGDAVLFPNVTIGDDSKIGKDAIVQSDVKIGSKVVIGGDTKIGQASVIEDNVTVGKWVKIGPHASIGSGAQIGPGATIADGATVGNSQIVPQGGRVTASK